MSDSRRREGPAEWTLGERYRVGREIGRGSYGVVHRAIDLRIDREIALKLIDLERDNGPEDAATERIGAALQQRFGRAHPGFVPAVFDHGEISGYYAIAMELIEAPSLNQTIARTGPLTAARTAGIALGIAGFLDRARRFQAAPPDTGPETSPPPSEQIVHGDLKPQHIKLLADGTVRVLDFGIAHGLSTSRTSATARGTSTHYASPELLETGRVRPQDDWWALGIMLFEMLAGVVPYHRYTLQPSLERAIRTGAPRDSLPPGTDPVLAAIVEKLLRPQPERRYPSAAAIARDLSAFLDGEPTIAESEAVTVATMRVPPPPVAPAAASSIAPVAAASADVPTLAVPRAAAPPAGIDVPTLPVQPPSPPFAVPPSSGSRRAATGSVAPVIPAAMATPLERQRMSWRRRAAWFFGIPFGLAMLSAMFEGPPEPRADVRTDLPAGASEDRLGPSTDPLVMQFVRIPPGQFEMGCSTWDEPCLDEQQPPHSVRISRRFELGRYEVTNAQWAAVTGSDADGAGEEQEPALVTWDDVQRFLDILNARRDGYAYRLPTEAEWEYAARAGQATGRGLDDMPRHPNRWGLYDMLGNAPEWVHDWFGPYSYGLFVDPSGPADGQFRIVRGMSDGGPASLIATSRTRVSPSDRSGFRPVRQRGRQREGL